MSLFSMLLNARAGWRMLLPMLAVLAALPAWNCPAQVYVNTFYNNTTYTSSQNINATNFLNDYGGIFSVIPPTGSGWQADLFQAWYATQNFTNNGEMDSDTGFWFEQHIVPGSPQLAGNFYNAGNISCGSSNNAIFIVSPNGVTTSIGGYGGIQVWATNIFNSGTITVGADGLGRFSGNNLNISRGVLAMENSFLSYIGQTNTANIYATNQTGLNTNAWYPDTELLQNSAQSSPPLNFDLPASTPYFYVKPADNTGTNYVVRIVFVQNVNTNNVAYNVYFGGANNVFSNGAATVEWAASYVDPASGNTASNYLYLNNDYIQGSSTNILNTTSPGIPSNFEFVEQSTPLSIGTPTTSSYPPVLQNGQTFPAGYPVTTNIYSFMNAQLIAATVSTNSVSNGSVTNLPGRFELVASNELNLSQAGIFGMNYLKLQSTNNFDNDGASVISSPYTDAYLGRTNNNMSISNLLQSAVPIWNGTVQAWSCRWSYTDTNSGFNYDYRALLVQADVFPTSQSQQQDVVLYSSNNLVINDDLNVYRTFYANCTNLLLAYNGAGSGVGSVEGELNLSASSLYWATATPRLRDLTNNGAISLVNQANFGSAALPYYAFVNTGTISNSGSIIYSGDWENSGTFTALGGSVEAHTFTTTLGGGVTTSGTFSNACSNFAVSNTTLLVGKSISLLATNLLTDGGATSNFWSLGSGNGGFGIAYGLILPIKPAVGDLLGTTVTNFATAGTLVNEFWSGQDRGANNVGFSNNAAIGQMLFDAFGSNSKTNFYFSGTGISNALYIDNLVLLDSATNTDGSGNLLAFGFNTNLVIYYAQAMMNGVSVAYKLNTKNNNHLRWVPTYAGFFSSTNLVYPPGVTNTVNAALAASSSYDSDGDGIPNSIDQTPFFVPAEMNFTIGTTSPPPKVVKLTWQTVPLATNYIYYKTNLLSPGWLPFTSFVNFYWSSGVAVSNTAHTNWFISPQAYPNSATNVWVFDGITNPPHFYQVVVQPNLLY